MIHRFIPAVVAGTTLLLVRAAAFAQGDITDSGCTGDGCIVENWEVSKPLGPQNFSNLGMNELATWMLSLIGGVSVLFIVWGGIKYISSGDDLDRRSGARRTITYAIVGLVIAVLAYAIVKQVLGVVYDVPAA